MLHRRWLKNLLPNSARPVTKSVATVVNKAAAATTVVTKSASLVKSVHPAKNVQNAHRAKSVRLVKNVHRVKSAPFASLVKPVKSQRHAKNVRPVHPVSASHVKPVKIARSVNCASLWTQSPPQPRPVLP